MPEPPAQQPFSPFLYSRNDVGLYPDAQVSGFTVPPEQYDFPYLSPQEAASALACITRGGVVDPLNLVLWGEATRAAVHDIAYQLVGWTRTLASAPQYGLGLTEAFGRTAEQRVAVIHSMQPVGRLGRSGHRLVRSVFAEFTKVVTSFSRQHVRVFEPFYAGETWGHVTLIGAHTEAIGRTGRWVPPLWHRVVDWHEARNRLVQDLSPLATDGEPFRRLQPTQGRWQRRDFDGVMKFLHF